MNQYEFIAPWGAKIKAYAREGTIDWNSLQSCVTEDEYRVDRLPDKGVAVDAGSYIGACSLALASKGYMVYAIEPLPENNEVAYKNFKLNNFDKIKLYKNALASKKDSTAAIYYFDTSTELGKQHEFIGMPVRDHRAGKKIEVPTITLEQIFKENNLEKIDFLKVDIEGGEWDIFENISEETLDKISRIAIEIDSPTPTTTTKFLKLLKDKFYDASPDYFPDWCTPGILLHGYFINKKI